MRIQSNENADGGSFVTAAEVKSAEDMVFYVDSAEDAFYDVSLKARVSDSSVTYISSGAVYVNGDDVSGQLGYSSGVLRADLAENESYSTGIASLSMKKYTLKNKVLLRKGMNEVRIKIDPRSDGCYFCAFDSMTFTPYEANIKTITKDGGTVECEDWAYTGNVKTNDSASGGKYVQVGNGLPTEGYQLDMYVNVENAGNYVINAVTGHRYSFYGGEQYAATHISPIKITVGGKTTQLNGSTAKIGTTGYSSSNYGEIIADNILKHSVKLEKGINKITFTAEQREVYDKGYYCELDCVKLSFADYMPAAGGTFEAENAVSGTAYTVIDADSASGKKFVKFDGVYTDEVIDIAINAEKAGKYQIKASAAVNNGDDATAALSHGEVLFGDDSFGFLKASDYYYLEEGTDYPFADYYLDGVFELAEGENTISFYPCTTDESTMKSAFDCIKVTPIVDLGTITAETAEVSLAPEATSQIVLKAGDKTVTADDVYMITYASSTADVASVSADGVITANNGGTADITVSVKENAVTDAKNVTVKVTVTDPRQIYFSGITADNGVRYSININTAFENALSVFTAAYNEDGSLNAVAVDGIEAGSSAAKPVITTITKPNGGWINLLVWDGMKPVLKEVIK